MTELPREIINRLLQEGKHEEIAKLRRRYEIMDYPICRYCGVKDSMSHECNPKDINIRSNGNLILTKARRRGERLIRLDRGFIIVQEAWSSK